MTFTSYNKARMYIYKGESDTSTYPSPLGNHREIDYSASPPSSGTTYDADYYVMQYFVAWQNPDTSSSLTYDGIQGRVDYKVYYDGSNYTAQCRWEDQTTPPTFDMKPQTAHNSDSTE